MGPWPEIFPLKIFRFEAIYGNFPFFMNLLVLPDSYFELLNPKVFRVIPKIDLVSTAWPPDFAKVRSAAGLDEYPLPDPTRTFFFATRTIFKNFQV